MTTLHRIVLAALIVIACIATAAYTYAQEPTVPALPAGDAPTVDEAGIKAPPTPAVTPPGWVESEPTPAETAQADPIGTAGQLVADVRAGDWRHAAALVLALLMLGLGKLRNSWAPAKRFFGGDRGGAVLVGLLAVVGALSTALVADAPLDWRLFAGALMTAWTAVGGYIWVKRIWRPKDQASGEV